MRAAVILLASLAFGGSALAAERAQGTAPPCAKLEKAKKDFPEHTRFTVLTAGQFHFVEGMYAIVPPVGLPPGDGAILATIKGKHGEAVGIVLWTHGDQACAPFPIPAQIAAMIPGIRLAPGETSDPYSDDELHL